MVDESNMTFEDKTTVEFIHAIRYFIVGVVGGAIVLVTGWDYRSRFDNSDPDE